jgi:hypothetical protein
VKLEIILPGLILLAIVGFVGYKLGCNHASGSTALGGPL